MSNEQTAISLLRTQYKQAFDWLEGTMEGVSEDVAYQQPAGNTTPIAGQLAHTITGMDAMILGAVAGKQPLMAAGNAGISEPPPQGGDWAEWGQRVKLNMPAFHDYSKQVFAEVDNCLASLNDNDLKRELDLPFGKFSVEWVFNIMLLNTYCHTGEISCLKGLQGLKGYPM